MAGGRTAPSRIADHTRHREVGPLEAIRQTIKTSAMIFTILIGATIFGYYMAMSKIPQQVVAMVALEPWSVPELAALVRRAAPSSWASWSPTS